ncbi:MAG: hypothetical protein EKK63_09085 [Acinetobacter sp.]|uniref:hypothetical protein n=1 Tax=Acinetobacter sp. TaxID=472 RepID=UPI000FC29D59|nr:hypothetical protein [Acinetobacter sp.]RUP39781.1 MAG: hypothetical protein EKK63_09085 [Acinetobacter sp.]
MTLAISIATAVLLAVFIVIRTIKKNNNAAKQVVAARGKWGLPITEREQYDEDYVNINMAISYAHTEADLIRCVQDISRFKNKYKHIKSVTTDFEALLKEAGKQEARICT